LFIPKKIPLEQQRDSPSWHKRCRDPSTFGAAENAGDIRTKDISTFLFPNAYLFSGTPCCVLGFHAYDIEPGSASNGWQERRYVLNYSIWITPGIFGGGFEDITALSHEMSETFNDPFVNDATPWGLSPPQPGGLCQNNLEVGDVIEVLTNPVFPINLNGVTWHPQTGALLSCFAGLRHRRQFMAPTAILTSPR
jgi:hypothetical protein